jgi:hypothetical protein
LCSLALRGKKERFIGFRRFKGFCPPPAGGFRGWWYRRFAAMKFYNSASQNGKPYNRASPWEMHPYPRLRQYFHPEGEVCSMLNMYLIRYE